MNSIMETSKPTSRPVCFFDSGIGGLTLFAQCVKKNPQFDYVYFADNANVPYGNRAPQEIYALAHAVFERISAIKPLAAVVACNTVTAVCAEQFRREYPFQIVGIQPALKPAAARGGKCLVLATGGTLKSQSFQRLFARYGNEHTTVCECPSLADYIERHIGEYPDIDVRNMLPRVACDSVVLGCTHYTFAEDCIKKFYGCEVYDGILGTADHLGEILGIADHCPKCPPNVAFFGGDTAKNASIYNILMKSNSDVP